MEENLKIRLSAYENKISLKNKIYRLIWNMCYYILFRPFISKYFNGWRILILRIFGAKIDRNSSVHASVKIWAPNNLEMYRSLLAHNVICYNPGKIKISSESVISQYSYLCAASHDISSSKHQLLVMPIIIKSQVWIAADSFIGPGVTIGEGAVVGARSAVFKDVASWTVVGGNPAIFIKKRIILN